MSIVAEPIRMQDSLSGGTTNLLRMARNECRGALAFVALALDDSLFATATYPTMPDDDLCGMEGVDELVHQAWSDPELGHAQILVRSTQLKTRGLACARRLVVGIAPLCDGPGGKPWGMLGVVDPEGGSFEPPQIELLEQVTHRVASYLRARQEVREGVSEDIDDALATVPEDAHSPEGGAPSPQEGERPEEGARPDSLWWPVEPGPAQYDTMAQSGSEIQTEPAPFPSTEPLTEPSTEPSTGSSDSSESDTVVDDAPPAAEPLASDVGAMDMPLDRQEDGLDALSHFLVEENPVKGILSLGALLGRTGRLIGAGALAGGGALAFVVIEVVCVAGVGSGFAQRASQAIREELRFDDPVAQIGRSAFAAVVPLVPGGSDANLVEARVAGALRSVLDGTCEDAMVCSAHVVAESGDSLDADELLRLAVRKLREG